MCRLCQKNKKAMKSFDFTAFFGAMEGTRTPGLLIRSQSLYPAELPTHTFRSEHDVFYHSSAVLSTVFCNYFCLFQKRMSSCRFSVFLSLFLLYFQIINFLSRLYSCALCASQARRCPPFSGYSAAVTPPAGAAFAGKSRGKSAESTLFLIFLVSLLSFLCYNSLTICFLKCACAGEYRYSAALCG